MQTLDDIQTAIAQLPVAQRERIFSWLGTALDEDAVKGAAASYDASPEHRWLSFEDYLAFEEASPVRHEYVGGALHAMSGASESHEIIAGNLFAAIHAHLRGRHCTSYMGNFKLRLQVARHDVAYYPDIMVSCTRDGVERNFLRYPKLVVEVLSPSTRAIDQREKWLNYTQVATLEEYLLVSQDRPEVIVHRRSADWAPLCLREPGTSLGLESISLSIPFSRLYEKVPLRTLA